MLRVLIVDDYPDLTVTFSFLLSGYGYDCQSADSGAAAIANIQTFLPHVVFLDLELPDISGLDVAKRIRALNIEQPYIVAFTGYGTARDQKAALAAGCDAHLTKPSDPETIRTLLTVVQESRKIRGGPH